MRGIYELAETIGDKQRLEDQRPQLNSYFQAVDSATPGLIAICFGLPAIGGDQARDEQDFMDMFDDIEASWRNWPDKRPVATAQGKMFTYGDVGR